MTPTFIGKNTDFTASFDCMTQAYTVYKKFNGVVYVLVKNKYKFSDIATYLN